MYSWFVNEVLCFRPKPMRKSDLTDVSKPLKTEKKDALANIDINNYASKLTSIHCQL